MAVRKLAFIVAAASLFALAPIATRFGPVVSSVTLVWLAVLCAIFASGTAHSLAVASGALGALFAGVLASVSPTAAGAVLLGACFAERTSRVRGRTARAVHVLVALTGGALAGSLSNAFSGSSLPVLSVAILVAAVLAALPLLVEADDPIAHALEESSRVVSEPARAALVAGAALRRRSEDVPLDRGEEARVRQTWQSLLRLAEARVRLERSRPVLVRVARVARIAEEGAVVTEGATDAVVGMVDQRIADHVSVLGRAYTAVDAMRAATIGIDDTALKTVESMGDSLEDVSRAMVEVKAGST